ncbi:MAG: M15 family metallopeptidase [Bacteroidota bacterium]|nr:M15 family metallopeptidase [Bacteroidota bacterium]
MTKLLLLLLIMFFLQDQDKTTQSQDKIPTSNELIGKINPITHPDFVKADSTLTYFPEIYLRKHTYEAFLKMHQAALKDSIDLIIRSGTRTFYEQRYLWNQKFTGKRKHGKGYLNQHLSDSAKVANLLAYTAVPGTSRHHWGTDIDINETSHVYFKRGKGKKVYGWLQENAADYGFYQVYVPFGNKRTTGYNTEEWHWTYKPESDKFTRAYRDKVSYKALTGFHGDSEIQKFEIIKNYVYGINSDLLE